MEIQFPPEISGAEEFKAGPGDVAMLTFKIRAFPGADAIWNKVISEAAEAAEGEEAGEVHAGQKGKDGSLWFRRWDVGDRHESPFG